MRPSTEITAAEVELPDEPGLLDLAAAFGCLAPLEVDLGCGDGLFLTQLAALHPERNFLGVEQLAGRVRSTAEKIIRRRLTNARIVRCEIAFAVQHLLPPRSISAFHLMFPDPWPKRRHHVRRLVTENWLRSVARALTTDGTLSIATDHADYFEWMQRRAQAIPELELCDPVPCESATTTTFERQFKAQGMPIHRLVLRKVSPFT